MGVGVGGCSRALAQHCIHASHLKAHPLTCTRHMQLSTPLSLLVHSSKHCVYKRSGAKKARVQRRSGPACTDDPNSACTDDALTVAVWPTAN